MTYNEIHLKFALVFFLAMFIPRLCPAAGDVSRFGKPRPVELADIRPHLSDSDWYKEEWNFNAWTPKGEFVAVDFFITNIGIGTHKGGVKAKYIDASGKRTTCSQELDSDEWSSSRDGFSLSFGKVSVSGDLKKFNVQVKCSELKMDLDFVNQVKPYQPGSGVLKFGDQGVFIKNFPAARALVKGEIIAKDKTVSINAPGAIEHSATDLGPHQMGKRWFRFRDITSEHTIILAELRSSKQWAGVRRGWVMIYDKEGTVLATSKVNFEFDGFIMDNKSRLGYKIPRRVRIAASDGTNHLTGKLIMTGLKDVYDPTASLNAFIRAIVRRYTKPMDYKLSCKYDLRIKHGGTFKNFKGESAYRFIYVNP